MVADASVDANARPQTKTCTCCKQTKRVTAFAKHGKWRRGACRECDKRKRADAYVDNRDQIRQKVSAYAQRVARTPSGRLANLVRTAKQRAKAKGLPFALDHAWIVENSTTTSCAITGLLLDFTVGRRNGYARPLAPSIDRIDPSRGYVPGNVRVISTWANVARGSLSDDELKLFVSAAASTMLN